jgi:hypothetical protein
MHYTRNVTPLLVCSMSEPVAIALLPVPMLNPRPSTDTKKFAGFYKPLGKLISLHEDDVLRVRKYMERFATEALTNDGQMAFTLHGNQLMQCDPTVCGQPQEPLYAHFYPQYWAGEGVLPAGPAERIDITDTVLSMSPEDIAQISDGSPGANSLVDPEERGHYGPYTVSCEGALRAFFGVASLSAVTQAIIDEKKAGVTRRPPRAAPDLDAGGVWMVGVGVPRVSFACRADSIDDALAQTRQRFPGEPVTSACAVI